MQNVVEATFEQAFRIFRAPESVPSEASDTMRVRDKSVLNDSVGLLPTFII